MNKKLLAWTSILIGLQIVTAGAALGELIGPKLAGLAVLIVAGAQGATTNYTRGVVVDVDEADQRVQDVESAIVTRVDSEGNVRAGEAADVPTGDVVPIVADPSTGQPVPVAPVQSQLVA